MRDSVFILEATIDALGCNIDEFPISKCSIERIRTEKRKERAKNIKIDFQNDAPDVVTLHWDGKLLSALSARKSKEERLPIVISYELKEQLIAMPRLDNSTGKEQAQAVWKAILRVYSEKSIDDFISVKSQSLFSRLKIDDSFLNESPSSWANNASFLDAKKTFSMLRALNDTAER
ncbi:hypothetical protein AVEN_28012-1 [Araneus ventricosus]|uniref:Uncharacterized protein n=1 Tax=Araneus ventricosus TaxID=182803 RepID=A0A4Y2BF67_ARAVE|nr:hypothetical protein AVEN_28012-1 [Araneus ventricosus]